MKKTFLYIFIFFSVIVIGYEVMFIASQMVNIKYYFDDCFPAGYDNSIIPICQKEYFLELIFYAKILIIYALSGLILAIWCLRKNNSNKV